MLGVISLVILYVLLVLNIQLSRKIDARPLSRPSGERSPVGWYLQPSGAVATLESGPKTSTLPP